LFATVLAKANDNADVLLFDTAVRFMNVNPMDSTLTIAKSLRFNGGGTDFHCIFKDLKKAYDRIIILSDMQGWVGYNTPVQTFTEYKKKFNCSPYVYSFDLQGYGTTQFPENKVFCMYGFSDKVFDTMKMFETDKEALIKTIEATIVL
jgi:60 kDa SS-A/Ro ribonucleoprotein